MSCARRESDRCQTINFVASLTPGGHREPMNKMLLILAGCSGAVCASPALAHDFFLLPESFHMVKPGGMLVRATVGSNFPVPEVVVPADRAQRTWAMGSGRPQLHITGTDAKSLLLHVAGAKPGKLIVAFKSKPRDVEYAEDRIPLILGEYRVAPEAAAAVGRLAKPRTWQVISRRFAKTLACVSSCNGGANTDQPLDGTLEFVTQGAAGKHFQLLAGGRPRATYPVDLVGSDGKRQHLTTDAQGLVHVPAGAKGTMMLFAAFLTPPAGSGRFTLDLTSLTFAR